MNRTSQPVPPPPLLLDDREDRSLLDALHRLSVSVEVTRLEYPKSGPGGGVVPMGDACWPGKGPGGEPVMVGVERKRLSDLIRCIEDRRLAGFQLQGMRSTYQYLYLVAEGTWRPGPTGTLQILGKSGWEDYFFAGKKSRLYEQIDGFLDSMGLRAGVEVVRTGGVWETAVVLANRYRRWQKPWESHHSHDAIYCPDPGEQGAGSRVWSTGREAGPVEKFAATLPNVDRKAWKVGEYFQSVRDAANAGEVEWQQALGFKEGMGTARAVVEWIRRTKNGTTGKTT